VANLDRNAELKDHDITPEEWKQVDAGKEKELKKLLDTGAIRPHFGLEAERIRKEVAPSRILQSRFVKTRRFCIDDPQQTEVKCRWVVKGFQDPDIDFLERVTYTNSRWFGVRFTIVGIISMAFNSCRCGRCFSTG
jgi:hypothetical protein